MYGYIYKITNLTNGLIYVGQHKSVCFDERYWGSSVRLTEDINRIGLNNFDRIILEECDNREQLNERERWWIIHLHSNDVSIGYNRSLGGQSNAGFVQSDYQKSQARKALLGKKKSLESCQKMSLAKKGKPRSKNCRGTTGLVRMSFGENVKLFVKPELCNEYLESGYSFGWVEPNRKQLMKDIYTHKTYITKDGKNILIENDELEDRLNSGWTIGRTYRNNRGKSISRSKSNAIKIQNSDGKVKYVKFDDVPKFISMGFEPSHVYHERLNNKEKTS